jgi:hypothetical protein
MPLQNSTSAAVEKSSRVSSYSHFQSSSGNNSTPFHRQAAAGKTQTLQSPSSALGDSTSPLATVEGRQHAHYPVSVDQPMPSSASEKVPRYSPNRSWSWPKSSSGMREKAASLILSLANRYDDAPHVSRSPSSRQILSQCFRIMIVILNFMGRNIVRQNTPVLFVEIQSQLQR